MLPKSCDYPKTQVLTLNVQIGDIERVFDNEITPWLHHFTHQFRENVVGKVGLINLHAQQ
jgi:hypothetical protein